MEEIQNVITQIEAKIKQMQTSLADVKTENNTLKTEAERLSEKLSQRESEVLDFKSKYDELVHQKKIEEEKESSSKETQIDALVKEIDDCIRRLKTE